MRRALPTLTIARALTLALLALPLLERTGYTGESRPATAAACLTGESTGESEREKLDEWFRRNPNATLGELIENDTGRRKFPISHTRPADGSGTARGIIILTHGFTCHPAYESETIKYLSEHSYHVVASALPGAGKEDEVGQRPGPEEVWRYLARPSLLRKAIANTGEFDDLQVHSLSISAGATAELADLATSTNAAEKKVIISPYLRPATVFRQIALDAAYIAHHIDHRWGPGRLARWIENIQVDDSYPATFRELMGRLNPLARDEPYRDAHLNGDGSTTLREQFGLRLLTGVVRRQLKNASRATRKERAPNSPKPEVSIVMSPRDPISRFRAIEKALRHHPEVKTWLRPVDGRSVHDLAKDKSLREPTLNAAMAIFEGREPRTDGVLQTCRPRLSPVERIAGALARPRFWPKPATERR